MRTHKLLHALIAVAIAVVAGMAGAEEHDAQPLYVSVDCMKSTSPDYENMEIELWQPMHQELVEQGKRSSWALYRVHYGDRSKCDYYTVTTFRGREQLNAGLPIREVFQLVHRGEDFKKAMGRTWAARQHVGTELWLLADSTAISEHSFAIVNKMNAHDTDAYRRMESRVFKPGHEVLVAGGYRSGWAMYELVSPVGTSIAYNFGTVDFVDHLNPVPMAEAMLAAHPDRDIEDMHKMLELREHVSSETWALVASTVNPKAE